MPSEKLNKSPYTFALIVIATLNFLKVPHYSLILTLTTLPILKTIVGVLKQSKGPDMVLLIKEILWCLYVWFCLIEEGYLSSGLRTIIFVSGWYARINLASLLLIPIYFSLPYEIQEELSKNSISFQYDRMVNDLSFHINIFLIFETKFFEHKFLYNYFPMFLGASFLICLIEVIFLK